MGLSFAATCRTLWLCGSSVVKQKGSSFLELLIALAIFSIVMLGVCAASLQGLRITQEMLRQTAQLIEIQNESQGKHAG